MITRILFFVAGVILLHCGSPGNVTKIRSLEPGNHDIIIKHNNRSRRYIVHIPNTNPVPNNYPVVLNFHGGGGAADGHQKHINMDETADKEGFIVVYPNGTGVLSDRLLTWNAGECCGYAKKHNVDDVSFTRQIIRDLSLRADVDRTRIFATGFSNGAMFCYRLALEASDLIKAIAPVSGAMIMPEFNPGKPISIMHLHSIDDPRALYQGGLGPPFPMTNHRVMHQSVEETLRRWRKFNTCPEEKNELFSYKVNSKNGHTADKIVYSPCRNNTQVTLWKLTKAGHVWPGAPQILRKISGPSTDIIDANEEIWKFFKQGQ